jgi:CBS-domain-containing membrane protein
LKTRAESSAHRLRFAFPLLSLTTAREAMSKPRLVLAAATPVADARSAFAAAGVRGAPVVNSAHRFCGRVMLDSLDALRAARVHECVRPLDLRFKTHGLRPVPIRRPRSFYLREQARTERR